MPKTYGKKLFIMKLFVFLLQRKRCNGERNMKETPNMPIYCNQLDGREEKQYVKAESDEK